MGPDLVECFCECTTLNIIGNSPGLCNPRLCDFQPCPPDQFCNANGECLLTCDPNITGPTSTLDSQTLQILHVCVDSSNGSNTVQACNDRCDAFASSEGSLKECLQGLLAALGLADVPSETVPDDIAAHINPDSAQAIADIIIQECGTKVLDTLSGTCGLSSEGISALVDLFLCVFSPSGILAGEGGAPENARVCGPTSGSPVDPQLPPGQTFNVVQKNGCPQFLPDGGSGNVTATPVGGNSAPGTSVIAPTTSLVSVSGSDVNAASSQPSGSASTGRIGPILFISQFDTTIPDGNITVQGNNVSLSNGFVKLEQPVAGVISTGSAFTISAGKFRAIATAFVSGQITSVEAVNTSPVTGIYNETTGQFDLAGSLDLNGLNAQLQLELTFQFVNRPPQANAGPDQTVECTLPSRSANVVLNGSASFDPDTGDAISDYAWMINTALVAHSPSAAQVTTPVGLGTRVATLLTVDTHSSMSRDAAIIKVVDTKPPVFGSLPVLNIGVCDPTAQSATIQTPAVTDACDPGSVTVSGAVITANGTPLSSPIPISSGQVHLSAGNYVIRWTAKDGSGNTSTADQQVIVHDGIEAAGTIAIDDRASLRVQGSTGFATIGNTGGETADIGVQAQVGTIVTKGSVFLRSRSNVNGNIVAIGSVTKQDATPVVTGTISQHASVILPPAPTLSGVTFPSTKSGPVDLEPGIARGLAPGSYGDIAVKSSATLTLTTGTYFATSLDLEPQSRLNLDQTAGPIRLYVRNNVTDRGQIATTGGAAASFLLGFAGTSTLFIEAPFPGGTVIAPNAGVTVTSLGAAAFTGQLFARNIEVQPDATITCTAIPGS
jgi:hypothetical protein